MWKDLRRSSLGASQRRVRARETCNSAMSQTSKDQYVKPELIALCRAVVRGASDGCEEHGKSRAGYQIEANHEPPSRLRNDVSRIPFRNERICIAVPP